MVHQTTPNQEVAFCHGDEVLCQSDEEKMEVPLTLLTAISERSVKALRKKEIASELSSNESSRKE